MVPRYKDLCTIIDRDSARSFVISVEQAGWEWGNPVEAYRFNSLYKAWKPITGSTVFEALIESEQDLCLTLLGEQMGPDTKRNIYRLLHKNPVQYRVTPSIIHVVQQRPNIWEERLYIKQNQATQADLLGDFIFPENFGDMFL